MKQFFTFVSLTCALLLSSQTSKAQPYLNFYVNGSCPMDGLKDSNYRDGIGFSIEFLSGSIYKTRNNFFEIRLGMGFEYLHYGSSNRINDLVFDTPNSDLGSVRIRNRMTAFYFAPKFIFNTGRISPYFDLMGVSRSFYTNQLNRFNQNVDGYERQTTSLLLRNGRAHYGGSLGLMYNLGRSVVFDARVSYTTGAGIKFIEESSVAKDPNFESNITYRVVNAPVSNILVFRLGIMLQIKKCKDCPRRANRNRPNRARPAPSRPKKKPAKVKPVPKPEPEEPPINY